MLVFFVVSREKRITKQIFLVLCGYFFSGKSHCFFERGAGVVLPCLAPPTHSITVLSEILCDQTGNRHMAICCPVNSWKL